MKKLTSILLALALCLTCASALAETGGRYVLMNIPYDKFYENEVTVSDGLDAVTSATFNKPRTMGLAGGSYHVDAAGSDISGVIFPVYVEDAAVLETLGGVEITDESSVTITVTNRGKESTDTYTGADALFEAPSYSWYALGEEPALYKTLAADGSFSAIAAGAVAIDATASLVYDRHADMTISVTGADDALEGNVSAVILSTEDGTSVGLKHIENIWRKTQIGFGFDSEVYEALKGKRISEIKYITAGGIYTVSTDLLISDDELLPHLNGTYIDLFPEFAKEEYRDYWIECLKAYTDDDAVAEAYYAYCTQGFMGTLKGQEAIDAYGADPASMIFDCYLENGLASVTVNGDCISGVDAEGNEVFSHRYHYVENVPVTFFGEDTGVEMRLYVTDDEDAGMFTYFAFASDTIATAWHVEFRYGENADNIGAYTEGEYAYWQVGAINDNYNEKQIQSCIKLFVDENMGEEEAE